MSEDSTDEIFRIMISTDNHLGVNESDPIRKNDSFEAFDEVLQKAVEMNADMVLLGGDLFHDNKPSRDTIVKAMRILKKHCLNDRPVSFQVLSQQDVNFPSTGRVNYEDPNTNIGLPVFTIHGNHDDPTGTGRLSAVDIMSEASLVNYFGNMDLEGSAIGRLKISPILIQKGNTFVALYGLGNVRDERLARLFRTPGSVEWEREDGGKWFTIFTIHQNREKRSPKNYVDEESLPQFLDFILWGHEHQCIPEPQTSSRNDSCEILQAGSTVATSLSEGEADPKHCFMLEIVGDNYRVVKQPLETVRPFVYKQISLANEEELDPDDPKDVEEFLEDRVSGMIEDALEDSRNRFGGDIDNPKLPLVRLKVDYTGFSTINVQRFGQKFVNKVANPQDILIFSKHAQRKAAQQKENRDPEMTLDGLRPEELDQSRIEDLVAENLGPGGSLEVFDEQELQEALHKFVDKDDRHALDECVKDMLLRFQERLERNDQGATDGMPGVEDPRKASNDAADDAMEVEEPPPSAATGSRARSNRPGGAEAEAAAQARQKAPPRAATTTGNSNRGSAGRSSGRGLTQATLDFKRPASRVTTQPSPTATGKDRSGGAGASSSRAAGARGAARGNEDDMIDDDDDDDDMLGDGLLTQMSGVRPRPARKAAAAINKRKKAAIFSDDEISSPDAASDDGDDEDFDPEVIEIDDAGEVPARGGRRSSRASAAAGSNRPQTQMTSQRTATLTTTPTPFSSTMRDKRATPATGPSRGTEDDDDDEGPTVISDDSDDEVPVKPVVRRRGTAATPGAGSMQPSNRSAWGAPRS